MMRITLTTMTTMHLIEGSKAFFHNNKKNVLKYERLFEIPENNNSVDFDKIWHRLEKEKMKIAPKNPDMNNT